MNPLCQVSVSLHFKCSSTIGATALAMFCFAFLAPSALAQNNSATPKRVTIDWLRAARDAGQKASGLTSPATRSLLGNEGQERAAKRLQNYSIKSGMRPLANLGALVTPLLPGVSNTPVPVLAPVEISRMVLEGVKRSNANEKPQIQTFLSSSIERIIYVAGPSGYDAIITISTKLMRDFDIKTNYKPQLHLAGTALSFGDIRDGEPVKEPKLQTRYPGLRRKMNFEDLTYSFRQYGVPYFINIRCTPGPPQPAMLSCKQADGLVRVVLLDLRLIGGGPLIIDRRPVTASQAPRTTSTEFKYYPPGSLMPGSSEGGKGGSTSRIEYGNNLRFPIKQAPVFANSQVFMHWGGCLGQVVPIPGHSKYYKCAQTGKILEKFEGHPENYSYPWRDNYCEVRGHGKPIECPLKLGHAGQDLRASRCEAAADASRCKGDLFEVVAVTDGWAWWKTGSFENHLRLNADDGTNKLYYMYLHMSPASLRDAGMKRGELVRVKKGQVIGKVGHHWKADAWGTTTHLHFEIRRGDNIGKPLSPYFTLVRAYERLLGAKGIEIMP